MSRRSLRPSPAKLAAVLVAVAAVVFSAGTSGTLAGWTTATVINDTNSSVAGQVVYNNVYPSTNCAAGPRESTKWCTGSIAPTSSPGASATDTITNTNTGTVPDGKLTEQANAASCGVVQLSNVNAASHPLLPRYGTTFKVPDKWSTTSAISLDGTRAYAVDPVATSNASLLGSSSSIGVCSRHRPHRAVVD